MRRSLPILTIFFTSLAFGDPSSVYHPHTSGKEMRVVRSGLAARADALRKDCATYDEELGELQLNRKLVARFREEYLKEHFTELLGQFGQLWNHVYQIWSAAPAADKKVVMDFRRDWRQKAWYHQKDEESVRAEGFAALRQEYRERFKKFASKYFVVDPFDENALALQIRRDSANKNFPPLSVIELNNGELNVARHSRVQLPKELGGFLLHLKVSNDVYASEKKSLAQWRNFHRQKPEMREIMAAARKGAWVDGDDADFDKNEDRLALLIDERFEKCK